jgi:hypothetical protein
MDRAHELARYPFIESDYSIVDEEGHVVDHLLVDGFVFSFWIDHAVRIVKITEIDDAERGGRSRDVGIRWRVPTINDPRAKRLLRLFLGTDPNAYLNEAA